MARKIRKDSTLKFLLERVDVKPAVLKNPTGRKVRSDVKIGTLRKRSK
jgi:hypothetical protein